MPFIVIETSDPRRTAVVPLDGEGAIQVSEICRADTLADLMNRIEDEELRRCRAKHRAADTPVVVTAAGGVS